MEHLSADVIRASFVNASKGERARMNIPSDLDALPWSDLELLG